MTHLIIIDLQHQINVTTGGKLLPKTFFCQILFITVSQESHLVNFFDRKLQFMNFLKKNFCFDSVNLAQKQTISDAL